MRRFVLLMGSIVLVAAFGTGATAAVPPEIEIAPALLLFGVVNQGQTTPPKDLVVTNTSGRTIGPIAIEGADPPPETQAEVFELDDHCTGLVLQPGDHCALSYTFTPFFNTVSVARLDVSVLEQTGSAPVRIGSPTRITLGGIGTNPIQIMPTVVDFGAVAVGTTSAPIGLRLHNPSSQPFGPLNLGGASRPPEPPFEVDPSACWGAVLPSGGSCEMPVTFRPTSAGQVVASASVGISATANRASAEFSYQLQGCGDSPDVPCTSGVPSSSTSSTAPVPDTTTATRPTIDPSTTTIASSTVPATATSTPPVDGPSGSVSPGSASRRAGTALPRTGSADAVPLVAAGSLLVALGATSVLVARRRRQTL